MALEIEHKFLVISDEWRASSYQNTRLRQGYLNHDEQHCSVRVRSSANMAWLNIKSATIGSQRQEFEYEIPFDDASALLSLARKPLIEKTRYLVRVAQYVWEIDVFEGDNVGLVVAEIELERLGAMFQKPAWVGKEVTNDLRYYNTSLSLHPYKNWKPEKTL